MASFALTAQPACAAGRPAARAAARARSASAARGAASQKASRTVVVRAGSEGTGDMPLWQKVQRAPRDANAPVAQTVEEPLPDMSSVDVLEIEPLKTPLWSAKHTEAKPTMWQQVNASRGTADGSPVAATAAEEASAGPAVADVAKGSAPLWSQVHTKKPANMWQQVNVSRDQSYVDAVPGAPAEPEPSAPKAMDVAPAQPPAWQKVHLGVQGDPVPPEPEKKRGFFGRIFGFLGFGKN